MVTEYSAAVQAVLDAYEQSKYTLASLRYAADATDNKLNKLEKQFTKQKLHHAELEEFLKEHDALPPGEDSVNNPHRLAQ